MRYLSGVSVRWVVVVALACTPSSPPTSETTPALPSEQRLSWQDRGASPDERAKRLVAALTEEEKLVVVTGYFGIQKESNQYRFPEARPQ
jgi:beta-glucosidase